MSGGDVLVIDARGMRCPWPALRLGRALRDRPRRPIEVLADDPIAERELAAVATTHGGDFSVIASERFRVDFVD